MGEFSPIHWMIVLAIILLLFGGRKIPELAKGLGEGIRNFKSSIKDGESGFLVNTVDEAAMRILELLQNSQLRQRMGANGRESVRRQFLLSRLAEDWLDLIGSLRAASTD